MLAWVAASDYDKLLKEIEMLSRLSIPLAILAILAFPIFWFLARKFVRFLILHIPADLGGFSEWAWPLEEINRRETRIYSTETTSGREAEFLNERLRNEEALVRYYRIILIGIYLLIIALSIFY